MRKLRLGRIEPFMILAGSGLCIAGAYLVITVVTGEIRLRTLREASAAQLEAMCEVYERRGPLASCEEYR